MCRAVIHAFDNDTMIGEAFIVCDDTRITTAQFFKLVCRELLGKEKDFFHVPHVVIKYVAIISQFGAKLVGKKSFLEKAGLDYVVHDKLWDNSKLKATGFKFMYPTVEKGMKETITWYKENGWFDI